MFHLLFLVSSVCIVVGFAGEIHFPRTPISYSVPGFHFPWVAPFPPAAEDFVLLTCPPAAANSSPPASRAAAEGLRSAAFTFVAPAPRCPLRLPPNRAVRSHPLRGAYRAFSPGGNAVSFHIPGIMRNRGYIAAYSQKLEPCKSFFHSVSSLHDMNCGENLPAVRRTGPEPPIRGARVCPECGSNNRDIRPDFRVFRRSCGRRRRPFPPPAPRARRAAESQSSAMERC